MSVGLFLLAAAMAAGTVVVGVLQHMDQDGVVAGVQLGAAAIMALAMVTLMQLATIHRRLYMQLRPW
jgi:ABC-type long-subunit fatty acid transport system fused permease/ATPase subunit